MTGGLYFPWAGRIVVIAPECMGLRSFSAMMVFALALAIYHCPGFWRSLALFPAAAAIGVLGNALRILFLLAVMRCFPDSLYLTLHDAAGYAVIVLDVLALAAFCDWLKTRRHPHRLDEARQDAGALAAKTNGLPGGGARIIAERDAGDHGEPVVVNEEIKGN